MLSRFQVTVFIFYLITLIMFSCNDHNSIQLFEEVSASKSGIDFRNNLHPTEELNIITYLYYFNGGGIAAGDVNGDGLIDLYFTANQGPDALFLNEGNLQFRDITASSGVSMAKDWSSGAAFVDIDADGDLDLYVNKVSGVAGLIGHNELYINDGDGSFSEQAADFGLDFSGLATQTAFSDFDGDGDLDAYLLNHSIHDTERRIDTSMRRHSNPLSGDRLYLQSEDGLFINSSARSGIYQSRLGYGLGLAVADFTGDQYPEIYASNDFNENDYFYVNQGNGSFVESIASTFPFSSKFSMGNVAADVNSDGKLDLLTLDMRSASDSIRKSSAGDSDPRQFERQRQLGFLDQQARNVLHLSCDDQYNESAILYGIHSTDWSWAPLVVDFNLDGNQDIFIANGIWQRPNDLDYLKFTSAKAIQRNASNLELASLMPSGIVPNYLYLGSDDTFPLSNVASASGLGESGATTAALAIDLDNDGDLDLVTNNVNAPAKIFENTLSKVDTSQIIINVTLKGSLSNPFAIGAKIQIETDTNWKRLIVVQPVTGFQSSCLASHLIALPLGIQDARISVTWPDGRRSISSRVSSGSSSITFNYNEKRFEKSLRPISFPSKHTLNRNDASAKFFVDNPLYPICYLSDSVQVESPKYFSSGVLNARFTNGELQFNDTIIKDVTCVEQLKYRPIPSILDSSTSGQLDSFQNLRLLVAQKKNDGTSKLFIIDMQSDSVLFENHRALNRTFNAISSIKRNGNLYLIQPPIISYDSTLFVLKESVSTTKGDSNNYSYELLPQSYSVVQSQVTDTYTDSDTTYISRLWAPIEKRWIDTLSGMLVQEFIGQTGLWSSICAYNDSLILFENAEYNNLLVENPSQQLELHLADYDRNGEIDPIAVRVENGKRYTMFGLDRIAEQMPTMRKFFTSYLPFSSSTFDDMFPPQMSKGVTILRAESLASLSYNKKTGHLSSLSIEQLNCLESSICSGKGRLYLHPSLRSSGN